MKLHHFIGPLEVAGDEVRVVDTKVIHHIKDVLKIVVGEKIILADGEGAEFLVRVGTLTDDVVIGHILEQAQDWRPRTPVTLYAAILKRDSFEFLVEKTTELGVSAIAPFISERTVKLGLNEERLKRISTEAAEQSEQSIVPELRESVPLSSALAQAKDSQIYFFAQDGKELHEIDVPPAGRPIALFIGPEGGFTPTEVAEARAAGAVVVSLGKTMLRAETAATVTVFWATQILGK